tara:strand:+ start:211 stop:900 length:690 start_codon:yes stop_codon:yes gene_type:complete
MHKNNNIVLEFKNISHKYNQGNAIIEVLNEVNFKLPSNCIAGIVGDSGSGKSTLLQLAGLLEKSHKGNIIINNNDVSFLKDNERTILRRNNIGYVYQKIHLLPEFNALDNIIIPQKFLRVESNKARNKALSLLSLMKLDNRIKHFPSSLSGGEQQRVAIARALINSPDLVIADEPTGNLDSKSASIVTNLLFESLRKTKSSALIATHSHELAKMVDIVYKIDQGKIIKI